MPQQTARKVHEATIIDESPDFRALRSSIARAKNYADMAANKDLSLGMRASLTKQAGECHQKAAERALVMGNEPIRKKQLRLARAKYSKAGLMYFRAGATPDAVHLTMQAASLAKNLGDSKYEAFLKSRAAIFKSMYLERTEKASTPTTWQESKKNLIRTVSAAEKWIYEKQINRCGKKAYKFEQKATGDIRPSKAAKFHLRAARWREKQALAAERIGNQSLTKQCWKWGERYYLQAAHSYSQARNPSMAFVYMSKAADVARNREGDANLANRITERAEEMARQWYEQGPILKKAGRLRSMFYTSMVKKRAKIAEGYEVVAKSESSRAATKARNYAAAGKYRSYAAFRASKMDNRVRENALLNEQLRLAMIDFEKAGAHYGSIGKRNPAYVYTMKAAFIARLLQDDEAYSRITPQAQNYA